MTKTLQMSCPDEEAEDSFVAKMMRDDSFDNTNNDDGDDDDDNDNDEFSETCSLQPPGRSRRSSASGSGSPITTEADEEEEPSSSSFSLSPSSSAQDDNPMKSTFRQSLFRSRSVMLRRKRNSVGSNRSSSRRITKGPQPEQDKPNPPSPPGSPKQNKIVSCGKSASGGAPIIVTRKLVSPRRSERRSGGRKLLSWSPPPPSVEGRSSSTSAPSSVSPSANQITEKCGRDTAPISIGDILGERTAPLRPARYRRQQCWVSTASTCQSDEFDQDGSILTHCNMDVVSLDGTKSTSCSTRSTTNADTTTTTTTTTNEEKRVRFRPHVQYRIVQPLEELATESGALWYKEHEFQAMHSKIYKIVSKIKTEGYPRKKTNRGKRRATCIRGLERIIDPERTQELRSQAFECVMGLQYTGEMDDEEIAHHYRIATQECLMIALHRGRVDASDARAYNKNGCTIM